MRFWSWLGVLLWLGPGAAWATASADSALCAKAIARSESAGTLPAGLLTAVAVSESGRYDRGRRGVAPWPWTVNNAGDGRYFGTKEAAIAHVERLRAAGERNIDVGCMQINLMHHPDAFVNLDEAFEPSRNVAYGAHFLRALQGETRSWDRAVERYHTADPVRGRAYRERVYQRWPGATPELEPGPDDPPRVVAASTVPVDEVAILPRRESGKRRLLRPLRGNGFVSLRGGGDRVAVLRPSADRQLKPIVRPPRRTGPSLVRLTAPRRTLALLGP